VATTTAGISASLFSQLETGRFQPFGEQLYALVNHLGISLDELLGIGAGQETPI
jgi:transcriptional regulator with XRE-family HTH domain